jgi:alpha,alpha-trehalase
LHGGADVTLNARGTGVARRAVRPALICVLLLAEAAHSRPPPQLQRQQLEPPQVLFKDLFIAVQTAEIFPDQKIFPDAVPDSAPADILAAYHGAHPTSPEALRRFVAAHFALPTERSVPAPPAAHAPLGAHIDQLWEQLTRRTSTTPPWSSLLPLPQAYVVPGGRFREIYYWDSYFTMLGLKESGRRDLLADMVRDFAYLIDEYGHVPNGTRTYYLSRSQPPFFFEMLAVLGEDGAAREFAHYLPQLRREYAFWMQGAEALRPGEVHRRVVALPDGAILNRYWDDRDTPRDESYAHDRELARSSGRAPAAVFRDIRAAAESGWDFSSRWLADGRQLRSIDTTEILPVDLNSLLFGLENAIRVGCEQRADVDCARQFAQRAARRQAAIDRYLWDESSGTYLDYHRTRRVRVPRLSAATLYPLFVGVSSEEQARRVARAVTRSLLKAGGIVASGVETGQQWDAPNGWAPLQWIAVAGLDQYREHRLAEVIACRWLRLVRHVYEESGKLMEKYDVIDLGRPGGGGEYPLQDGFGWTNGVTRRLMALYPAAAGADSCAVPTQVTP